MFLTSDGSRFMTGQTVLADGGLSLGSVMMSPRRREAPLDVAATLSNNFRRDTDTAIRFGGEEFILISVGGTSADILERLEAFRRDIEQVPVSFDGKRASLTVSIGVWSAVPACTLDH